jgi:tetrahydromethanopterin S-methyltransferase subunit G
MKRSYLIVAIITGTVFVSIMLFMYATKDVATRKMQAQIDSIMKKMECPNNECDRYKGKDAARDLAIVHGRIDELEKNCDCKKN